MQPVKNHKVMNTNYIKNQSIEEWISDYEGRENSNTSLSQDLKTVSEELNKKSIFQQSLKEAGIQQVRLSGKKLLISLNKQMTEQLKSKLQKNVLRLIKHAIPDTGEPIYEYIQYRTFVSRYKGHLALIFRELHTGKIAERYFNIEVTDSRGNPYETGINGKFRIKGNIKRPIRGSFIYFWLKSGFDIPDNRPSHIDRYVNSRLSGMAFSCNETIPYHDIIKLKNDLNMEGYLYDISNMPNKL